MTSIVNYAYQQKYNNRGIEPKKTPENCEKQVILRANFIYSGKGCICLKINDFLIPK